MRYTFVIAASQFTSSRIKISFIPGYYPTTSTASTSPYSGDVYSKVIDVSGDTCFTFEVPFIYSQYWCESGTYFQSRAVNPYLYTTGKVMVEVVNQMSRSDASEPVQWAEAWVYVSGGPDFQLAGLFGQPEASAVQLIDNLVPTSSIEDLVGDDLITLDVYDKVVESKYNMADNFISITHAMKRYSLTNQSFYLGKLAFSNPPRMDNNTFQSLFQYLLYPFRFYRGAIRYKIFLSELAEDNKIFYLQNATMNGSIYNGGVTQEIGPNGRLLSIEIPYYFPLPGHFREAIDSSYINQGPRMPEIWAQSPVGIGFVRDVYRAAGDDFVPMCVRSPPLLSITNL